MLSFSGNQLHFLCRVFNKCDIGRFRRCYFTRNNLYRGGVLCSVTLSSRKLAPVSAVVIVIPGSARAIFLFIGDTWCLIKFSAVLKFLINATRTPDTLFLSAQHAMRKFRSTTWTTFRENPLNSLNGVVWRNFFRFKTNKRRNCTHTTIQRLLAKRNRKSTSRLCGGILGKFTEKVL